MIALASGGTALIFFIMSAIGDKRKINPQVLPVGKKNKNVDIF